MKIFGREINLWRKAAPMLSPVGSRGWFPIIREPYSGAWQKNVEWSVDCVLAHHAVYACVTLIANDIGKLRQRLVRADDEGIWTETTSAAFSPVLRRPNRYQNHIQFKQWWITCKLIRGNAYALKVRDNRDVVVALYLLDPNRVQVLVSESGDVFYQLQSDNLSGVDNQGLTVPASEIIHDRMNCLFHPLVGVSPLFAAGCVANLGLEIEKNSSKFFGNASRPGGILTAPGAISDQTSKELKDYFNANFTGDNAGKVAVVGDGLKYERLSITAADSQLIEQLKWTADVVCSVFHVPGFKVGVGTSPTYQNSQVLNQIYYDSCLQVLIEEYEACMDEGLALDERTGVDLDLDGLLRMDSKTQIEVLNASVSGSLRTINEARGKMSLGAVAGGDVIWSQQQNWPISELAKRPAEALGEAPKLPAPAEPQVDQEARSFISMTKAVAAFEMELAA